jgi:hypothetical protein
MDPIVVDIPGVGPVEFPANMPQAEIDAAAKRLHDEASKEPVVEKESPELFGYAGAGLGGMGAAGDVIYSKGRPIIRAGEKLLGMQPSGAPEVKPRVFADPAAVAQRAIDIRTPQDVVPEGSTQAVKNWTQTQHTGDFLGGGEYGEADVFAKERAAFEKANPTQKVLPGSRLAIPEQEAQRLAEQRAALQAEQNLRNQAEVNAVANTRAQRLMERENLQHQLARKNVLGGGANIAGKVALPVLGGYEAGSQSAQAYNRLTRPDLQASDVAAGAANILGAGAGLRSMFPGKLRVPAAIAAQGAAAVANWLDKRNPRNEEVEQKADGGSIQNFETGGLAIAKKLFTPIATKIVKASEALAPHESKVLNLTQSDRLKAIEGELGGHEFSKHQLEIPEYAQARASWGVASPQEATKISNRNKRVPEGQSIWAPLIGSETQHQTNPHVFDPMLEEFYHQVRMGNLPPETAAKMKAALGKQQFTTGTRKGQLMFPEAPDVTNEDAIRQLGTTFENRGPLSNILFAAQGAGKTKGQIIDYKGMLQDMADPKSIGAPTHSVGTRLFTLDNGVSYRPDLHSAFPHILTGEDLGVSYQPIPKELALADYIQQYRDLKGEEPGTWAFTRKPLSVLVDDKLLRRLDDAGMKKGGKVKKKGKK